MTPDIWEEVERRQAFLRTGRLAGEITEEDYATAMARLRLQDDSGTWWQVDDDGGWLHWDGATWQGGRHPTGAERPLANTINCPHCQADIGADKKFCNQCGEAIRVVEATGDLAVANAIDSLTQSCPHCQAEVGADKRFCTQCGRSLEVMAPAVVGPAALPPTAVSAIREVAPQSAETPRRGWLLWVFGVVAFLVLGVAGFLGWQARQARLDLPVAVPEVDQATPVPVMRVQSAAGRQIAARGTIRLGIGPEAMLPLRAPTPEQGVMTGFEVEWGEAVVAALWGERFPVTWVLMPPLEGVRQVVSGEIDAYVGAPGQVAGVRTTAPYLANDRDLWAADIGANDAAAGWVIILAPGSDELAMEMDGVRDELVAEGVWTAVYRRWFDRPPPPDALPGWVDIPAGE